MGNMANGVEWIDDLTFKTPDGRVWKMIKCDEHVDKVCSHCDLSTPDGEGDCDLDRIPMFKDVCCWGNDSNDRLVFYYIKEITDG